MYSARQLRIRIALVLTSSGIAALPACGSTVETSNTTSNVLGGAGGVGGASNGTGGSTGTMPPAGCTEECQLQGTAACPAASQVEDGCCNPAMAGPFEKDGQCCYWFCDGTCCGRPFTVAGHARVAGVMERADWSAKEQAGPVALDPRSRAAIVEAWIADAQMEHASVASFARFTLELLALGAPADLVADSQRASLDEVEHARLCFGIAARLGERSFGPAPLDLAGALRGGSLAESAACAVREGCIGETLASLMARAQLDHAKDEGVRRALARIADDEEAHAALAWRFVAWAIALGGEPVRAAVTEAFADGARQMRAQQAAPIADGVDEASWHRFGRLTPAEADAVTTTALDDVIAPCADMLLRGQPIGELAGATA
ncbi:MAG: ferritin-like domain-containing protein [Minicystis sp.]